MLQNYCLYQLCSHTYSALYFRQAVLESHTRGPMLLRYMTHLPPFHYKFFFETRDTQDAGLRLPFQRVAKGRKRPWSRIRIPRRETIALALMTVAGTVGESKLFCQTDQNSQLMHGTFFSLRVSHRCPRFTFRLFLCDGRGGVEEKGMVPGNVDGG
jgi:hypothetical protein